ncbi:NAD-dependent epimerase/dehydratase family protein [Actinomadura kijaniata]|uniref:NAD-dependent epimerase/dehydratase family protein n=1 Tax=Actinomadura kijaniata TaxID=46161 RepID=UPI00083540D7|nr:NAD-dependent epimerase/dehydratase family protein [Actinomadura kijaniata]
MLVSVTGGTGFLGAHTVSSLVGRGHRVRLLARDERRVEPALGPLGVDRSAVEVVVGDVTDEAAVGRLVRGADAVLHAASVYSFDSRRRASMRRTNERGTEVVLGAARRLGADPVVHVSTFGVLEPDGGRRVRADAPVGRPRECYLSTKAAAERIARRHRSRGAPVVITYPAALLGPDDPKLGDQTARLRNALRGLMPIWPLGGFPVGDVRDAAAFHADLFDAPGRGAERLLVPGRHMSTREYVATLRQVTGRRLPTVFLPARAVVPVGLLTDAVQRVWPWHIPAEYGAVHVSGRDLRVDVGPGPRPVTETFGDTVRWLHRAGLLSARQAGRAAEPPSRALQERREQGKVRR